MKLMKLVIGVIPTCWRPPFGDTDDRIRFIADQLGLRTIIWKYDSFDWTFGTGEVTKAQIDANYQNIMDQAKSGTFASRGAIMLTHEINNFTMQEAIDYYGRLQDVFKYIVPVGVAYNGTQPYVEKNYSMPTFEQYINGTTTSGNQLAHAPQSQSASSTSSGTSSTSIETSGAATLSRSYYIGKLWIVTICLYILL
ncbi:hypothetical protein Ac2012v2_004502 [Leucoagaricus gongylophorus]